MRMIELPTLYKKTSTGAIQYWTIRVHPIDVGGEIETEYGQLNTDKPQITHDTIITGKNIGKKNETSAFQQAESEAKARHGKQLKKGYVISIEDAKSDKVDEIIEGGIVPMLAHKFAEKADKIKYPAFVQGKLDGIRCIAIVKDGECTLWSRTRKPITSCPHIVQELEAAFETQDIVLDGELFNLELKSDFEKIVSMVRQEEPAEGHEIIQYHVYDTVNGDPFRLRTEKIARLFEAFEFYSLKLVQTEVVHDEDEIMDFFDEFRAQGLEGAMVRNANSLYVNKRSNDLLKVKEFDDSEFDIIGIEEGRGKLAGHAIFVCKTDTGKEFMTKMKGETSKLKEYFDDHTLWQNKRLTVQYQGLTSYGIPRFPVGKSIRNYE